MALFGLSGASLKFRQFRSAVFDALGYFTCVPCGVFYLCLVVFKGGVLNFLVALYLAMSLLWAF